MSGAAFASVVLDVDSTLCNLEGIDWLAARRDPALAGELAALTLEAMAGRRPLESIYRLRLERIRPTAADLAALGAAYRAALAPGAAAAIARLRAAGVAVHLVSGGIRQAIRPTALALDFPDEALHAVTLELDAHGNYSDFDSHSPLTTADGKCEVVASLGLPTPVLAVGDGMTDAALRAVTDTFAAFTGFVRRPGVVALARHECRSFDEILSLVWP